MNSRKMTLIGSFRKNQNQLRDLFIKLSKLYTVLSPQSVDFIDPSASFVKTKHEQDWTVHNIEEQHLQAIRESEFVWLFAPKGYVGTSAAFEIGFAHSIGIPVYTDTKIEDEMVSGMITEIVTDPSKVTRKVHRPGYALSGLQLYYSRIADERGWAEESARDTMLLLTEEIGELARAIRKFENLQRDSGYSGVELADELADVQLYLVHLANRLDIQLSDAVTQKEMKNHAKHEKRTK